MRGGRVAGFARASLVVALLLLAGAAAVLPATVSAAYPAPLGYLSDFAQIVDAASADSITSLAKELQEKTGAELAVVTLRDLGGETIDPAATALFKQWGIGHAFPRLEERRREFYSPLGP